MWDFLLSYDFWVWGLPVTVVALLGIFACFYFGWQVLSPPLPPFTYVWDFLQSIWYWLPYAIVGPLITIIFVRICISELPIPFFWFFFIIVPLLLIIVPLLLAAVVAVVIALIGLVWALIEWGGDILGITEFQDYLPTPAPAPD